MTATSEQPAPMRLSPDGRDVAIRNRDDDWFPWRVTDGSQRDDRAVADWTPLPHPEADVEDPEAEPEPRRCQHCGEYPVDHLAFGKCPMPENAPANWTRHTYTQ